MKYPVVRCEPESLKIPVEGSEATIPGPFRIQMMQGGLELGKPTIIFLLEEQGNTFRFRCSTEDLRMALDFLEPAPPKRVRLKKPKAAKIATALTRVLTPEGGHRG